MNIITADFNWISLLITVVTIIGLAKSIRDKHARKPVFQRPDLETEDADIMVGDSTNEDFERLKDLLQQREERELPGNYYAQMNEQPTKTSPIYQDEEEEREETSPTFDIRQAIISSEILRRPQF